MLYVAAMAAVCGASSSFTFNGMQNSCLPGDIPRPHWAWGWKEDDSQEEDLGAWSLALIVWLSSQTPIQALVSLMKISGILNKLKAAKHVYVCVRHVSWREKSTSQHQENNGMAVAAPLLISSLPNLTCPLP